MIYNDGKYHIEFGYHEGRKDGAWFLVNVYGELCYDVCGTMCYTSPEHAQPICDKANERQDGAICTDFHPMKYRERV